MHGYEVMTGLGERSGGRWRPSPGSVYPTLQQLEDVDIVRAAEVEGKRVFSLTDAGRAAAEKLAKRGAPWEAMVDPMGDEARVAARVELAPERGGAAGRGGRGRRADRGCTRWCSTTCASVCTGCSPRMLFRRGLAGRGLEGAWRASSSTGSCMRTMPR